MRIIDLTREIRSGTQVFAAYPKPAVIPWAKHEIQGYAAEVIFMATHTSTHIDAPYHFAPDGARIDEVSPDRFIGDAILLDLSYKKAEEYITAEDVRGRLEEFGIRSESNLIVLFRTGWEHLFGRIEYLTAHPGLSRDAAEYLTEIGAKMVGIDTPNIDHPKDLSFAAHKTLLPRGVLIIENLANLSKVENKVFRLIALPLKIVGSGGSPARVLAIEE